MARLFADENFTRAIVDRLRALGHDVLTLQDVGRANQGWPDEELFLFCIAQQRVVLTRNRRHFYKLHERFPAHPGVIACTEDPDVEGAAQRIHEKLSSDIAGQFVRIYRPHTL